MQRPLPSSLWSSSKELERCQAIISALRSSFFYTMDQTVPLATANPQGFAWAGPGGIPSMPALIQQVRPPGGLSGFVC
eukprot:scaffold655373_cov42-Prasinocladus_malaysianus.AAC.1